MIDNLISNLDVINVKDLTLWAHVGVLEKERLLGQPFSLDFSLWIDVSNAARNDDLSATVDYSIPIKGLQDLAFRENCLTIERFSETILDFLEGLYGQIPMKIVLRKCEPPVAGFNGYVEIERKRNISGFT
tara:strand:- start:78 stop:470 length:393 start_codon:yes stop_codon:yes gene_type:complete